MNAVIIHPVESLTTGKIYNVVADHEKAYEVVNDEGQPFFLYKYRETVDFFVKDMTIERPELKFAVITPERTVLTAHRGFMKAQEALKETLSEGEDGFNPLRLFFPGEVDDWDINIVMTPAQYLGWPQESRLCIGGRAWIMHWEKNEPDDGYVTSNITPVYLVDMDIWEEIHPTFR